MRKVFKLNFLLDGMKKSVSIGIIVVIIAVIGIYVFYQYATQGTLTCAKAGYGSSNPSLGSDDPKNKCCLGLVEISNDLRYEPDNEYTDERGYYDRGCWNDLL